MSKRVNHIAELIGNTPLVKLNRLTDADSADIYVKVEAFNAGGSVKDRIALNIIETAEREGQLKPGDTIIEATSGNTGVGLSLVGAAKGYKVITIMPDSMSIERRQLMKAYGTEAVSYTHLTLKVLELPFKKQKNYHNNLVISGQNNLITQLTQAFTIKQLVKKLFKPSMVKHLTHLLPVLEQVELLQVSVVP